jgi:hypothetical protein
MPASGFRTVLGLSAWSKETTILKRAGADSIDWVRRIVLEHFSIAAQAVCRQGLASLVVITDYLFQSEEMGLPQAKSSRQRLMHGRATAHKAASYSIRADASGWLVYQGSLTSLWCRASRKVGSVRFGGGCGLNISGDNAIARHDMRSVLLDKIDKTPPNVEPHRPRCRGCETHPRSLTSRTKLTLDITRAESERGQSALITLLHLADRLRPRMACSAKKGRVSCWLGADDNA